MIALRFLAHLLAIVGLPQLLAVALLRVRRLGPRAARLSAAVVAGGVAFVAFVALSRYQSGPFDLIGPEWGCLVALGALAVAAINAVIALLLPRRLSGRGRSDEH